MADAQGPGKPETIAAADMSRRDTRSMIFHYLYAMESHNYEESLQSVVDMFNRGYDLAIPYDHEMIGMVQEVVDQRDALDEVIKPLLHNWRFERVGVSTKLILRFALWELQQKKTASTIVINEAIELAKSFAEKDAYKFINGILDEFVKKQEL